LINLDQRSDRAELMDDPQLGLDEYSRCLADLAKLNRLALAHRPVLQWLAQVTADLPRSQPIRILDVGFGQGDLLRAIGRWARSAGVPVALQGIDSNPRSVHAAHRATPRAMHIHFRSADVFAFEPAPQPDFVISSQFVHHLHDGHVVRYLRWCELHAQRGWFIADLQRNVISYYGFRWLARLAGMHPVVRHDGAVSIARSFRREDWQVLLLQAGLTAGIQQHFPFRLSVERLK
jgi:2-polyprenyl-3-methyl-5-hydroxy-6-metoxy-1,4-benzoquinol methylase